MQGSYPYEPAIHRLFRSDAAEYLAREVEQENLVTYHHEITGNCVVSLLEGGRLFDIGLMGTGAGEGPWLTRANAKEIVRRMKTLISLAEARKRLRRWETQGRRDAQAREQRYFDGIRKAFHYMKRRHGPMKADIYANAVDGGMTACKGDKPMREL